MLIKNKADMEYQEFLTLDEVLENQPDILEYYEHMDPEEYQSSWVEHNDSYYHLSDFIRYNTPWTGPAPEGCEAFHGFRPEGYSVLLIKLSDCGDGYLLKYKTN